MTRYYPQPLSGSGQGLMDGHRDAKLREHVSPGAHVRFLRDDRGHGSEQNCPRKFLAASLGKIRFLAKYTASGYGNLVGRFGASISAVRVFTAERMLQVCRRSR